MYNQLEDYFIVINISEQNLQPTGIACTVGGKFVPNIWLYGQSNIWNVIKIIMVLHWVDFLSYIEYDITQY